MTRVIRARHAVWAPICDGVIETIGRGTPVHMAAIRARLGRDLEGEEFAKLAARLPVEDRARLLASIEERAT